MDTPFQIYDASAGSGKTYTLTKEYLKIILTSSKSYQYILAITFTNKAVNEMKSRILDSLYDFSKVSKLSDASSMFRDLLEELQIDATTLQNKAKTTLKDILHNYAFFDISTIDKFTHRVIRTFAKDLKLPQNFEVIIDTNLLLDEAVSRLVNKAGSDAKLTQVLVDFALEKIDDDKSWDITLDLNKIGKLLFNENNISHLQKFEEKGIEDFLALQKVILKKINACEINAQSTAKKAPELINLFGLEPSDFPRETLPNHFKKIIQGVFEPTKLYNNKLEENLVAGKILKASAPLPSTELPVKLLGIYLEIKEQIYERALLKNVYKNIVPLTVLNAIQQEIKAIEIERDQLPLYEFNKIISNEIKDQPAPFIYERLGEKYKHYFIDEFQDTSEMQWQNLVPLIGNALSSENGSLFLVGDAKQAIYRWRGGKAEQFLNLISGHENPFVVSPKVKALPSNFRSHEEIVNFNNDFFTITSPFLNNEDYKTLFKKGNKQHGNTKKGGQVQFTFLEELDDIDLDEQYGKTVLNTINEVLEKEYHYKDICILVRGNKEGVLLANFLTQAEVPIISSESLLLKSNPKIQFLVNVLRFKNQPEDLDIAYNLLSFLSLKSKNQHTFIEKNLQNIALLFQNEYGFAINYFEQASVYDGLEYAIRKFDLVPQADAYINFFMDTVYDVEQKEGTGIPIFLSYWEKKKDRLSIAAPATINAVQIMTIHKAKGLEFNITIFPYANAQIYREIDPKLWLPVSGETFNGFEEMLISKKQEVVNYNALAEALYENENHELELDAFNVLYVALTRAVKALYIISKKESSSKVVNNPKSYTDLFTLYLKEKGLWNESLNTYSFGVLDRNKSAELMENQNQISYQYSYKERSSFRILTKSGQLWDTEREEALSQGNLLHFIMGLIETEEDVENALSIVLRKGDIHKNDLSMYRQKILQIIRHPKLHSYFSKGKIIKNEKDIITKKGSILRPDRVVIDNQKATVLDYKTGKPDARYKEQVYSYADALQEMNFTIENKIIIYINEEVTPEFI